MVSITFVYLIAGIGIVIGIAIGMVVVGLRQDASSKPRQDANAGDAVDVELGLSPRPGTDSYELILDDVRYQSPGDLGDTEKARVLVLMKELWAYTKADVPPVWDFTMDDIVGVSAQPQGQVESVSVDVPISPKAKAGLNPMEVFTRALQPDPSKAPQKSSSIAAQIDEILQEMINGTPMDAKGIRLYENPNKGLVVLVGMTQYDSVEDVADEEVRKVIHAAVLEWERRMAPD